MNKLTTRKIVLGLLIAFVLALGVQGIADAQSVKRSSGDRQLKAPGEKFTIYFKVSGVDASNTTAIDLAVSGLTVRQINGEDSSATELTRSDITTTDPNYLKNGSHNVTYSVDSIDSSSLGKLTLTNLDDFVIYIAPTHNDSSSIALDSSNTDGLEFGRGEQQIDNDFTITPTITPGTVRVKYKVVGSGTLYVEDRDSERRNVSKEVTISKAATVYLKMGTGTSTVTASIVGQRADRSKSVIYIYDYAKLTKQSGDDQQGAFASRLAEPLVVKVVDGKTSPSPVSGVMVDFEAAAENGTFIRYPDIPTDSDRYPDSSDFSKIKTNSSGEAHVFWVLNSVNDDSTNKTQTATASLGDVATAVQANTVKFTATAGTSTASSIVEESGDEQTADQYNLIKDPLVVTVRNERGQLFQNGKVEFLARDGGTLSPPGSDDPGDEAIASGDPASRVITNYSGTSSRRVIFTNTSGQASIRYTPPTGGAKRTVSATILNTAQSVIFTINGTSPGGGGDDPQTPSLSIGVTGEGTTRSVTVTATNAQGTAVPGLAVALSGTALPAGSQSVVSGTPATITPPTTPGTYTLQAVAANYTVGTATVTVAVPQAPGTLTLATVGARVGTQQQIRVTASGRTIPSGGLVVTLSGVSLPRTVTIPSGSTSTTQIVTLPSATSAQTVSASATGYNASNTLSIPAPGSQPPTTGQQPTPTTGTASSVRIRSEAFPSGSANTQLAQPLSVRVLDANGNGVRNVRVTFEVTSGNGRLSQRGNGKAARAQTNASGDASTPYTPRSASSTVRATAAGVSQTVTFTITTDGATTTTPTPTPTPGTGDTPTTISPVVHVGAAQRPPMLWVDGGKIYALVGSDVQSWSPSVDNAMNITVAGDKVYWTEKTGESGGTINAANLDGTGVTEITKILATPTGIAVDTTARRIYVVNTGGRILSMNLDGTRIQTVLQNLSNPKDIAVSGGNAYWTQDTGAVRFVNLSGTKNVRNISNGADAAVSLVISGNKVYWTEHTGESGGTIKAANLNGTGVTRVASILAAPTGIAVDAARSKIYVTNTGGRILRMNLNGSYIQTVADGLGMPGDMVINNSIKAPAATPTPTPTPTASGSKYDVNGDGVVDAKDKALVFDAVMAGTYIAKYDVNDDKKLDILDYVRVDVAIDTGAASAPSLLGTKFTAREVDRLQEQIDLLIAIGDRSPAAIKTLIYLQQLIVMARPEKTQLLANYPNPFNPETWIPYELATDTEVRITIYNAQGVVIRTLQLGQQSAGYYTDRERAAYWDGRNALGEQVASGIYFYQFETDTISSMRKMVILK